VSALPARAHLSLPSYPPLPRTPPPAPVLTRAFSSRPFPEDPDYVEETHQLTVRAVLVGCVLGAIVGASNIYLGLKTGFTFGPQLFGAIFGYAILKPLSRAIPESGLLAKILGGGDFGKKENCTVQSAATAAGGIGIIFVSAIPAMYNLGLLSATPQEDAGRLIALTLAAAFFGVFFVIPLRKYYIVRRDRVHDPRAALGQGRRDRRAQEEPRAAVRVRGGVRVQGRDRVRARRAV
jgi:hypothetical protein